MKLAYITSVGCILTLLSSVHLFSNTLTNKVSDPVFMPPGGQYSQTQNVTLSCATNGVEIRYTTDGSIPPANSYVYSGPFNVPKGTVVKAIGIKPGMSNSNVVSAYYTGNIPWVIGSIEIQGARSIALSGIHAFITSGDRGVWVIDVSKPSAPLLIGGCDTPGFAREIAVSGNYAYVADGACGLQIIDLSYPQDPYIYSHIDIPGEVRGVSISSSYAYVVCYEEYDDGSSFSALYVVNIANPKYPEIASVCDTPSNAQSICIQGDYAYIADYFSGVQIISIQNPRSPYLVAKCDTPGRANKIAVSGSFAYVADEYNGMSIINISTQSQPVIINSFDNTEDMSTSNGIAVIGNLVYLLDGCLWIIDCSNPSNLSLLSTCSIAYGTDIVVRDKYAYIVDHPYGLRITEIKY